jgi:hypothetical protein
VHGHGWRPVLPCSREVDVFFLAEIEAAKSYCKVSTFHVRTCWGSSRTCSSLCHIFQAVSAKRSMKESCLLCYPAYVVDDKVTRGSLGVVVRKAASIRTGGNAWCRSWPLLPRPTILICMRYLSMSHFPEMLEWYVRSRNGGYDTRRHWPYPRGAEVFSPDTATRVKKERSRVTGSIGSRLGWVRTKR